MSPRIHRNRPQSQSSNAVTPATESTFGRKSLSSVGGYSNIIDTVERPLPTTASTILSQEEECANNFNPELGRKAHEAAAANCPSTGVRTKSRTGLQPKSIVHDSSVTQVDCSPKLLGTNIQPLTMAYTAFMTAILEDESEMSIARDPAGVPKLMDRTFPMTKLANTNLRPLTLTRWLLTATVMKEDPEDGNENRATQKLGTIKDSSSYGSSCSDNTSNGGASDGTRCDSIHSLSGRSDPESPGPKRGRWSLTTHTKLIQMKQQRKPWKYIVTQYPVVQRVPSASTGPWLWHRKMEGNTVARACYSDGMSYEACNCGLSFLILTVNEARLTAMGKLDSEGTVVGATEQEQDSAFTASF